MPRALGGASGGASGSSELRQQSTGGWLTAGPGFSPVSFLPPPLPPDGSPGWHDAPVERHATADPTAYMWGGGAAQGHRRRHAAMVTTAEFREVSAARSERRAMEVQLPSGGAAARPRSGDAARRDARATLRQHSVMLSDPELSQLGQLREAAAAYHPSYMATVSERQLVRGGDRPRSAGGRRSDGERSQANFTAVAHLYHANSNRSSVAWEAGLRR